MRHQNISFFVPHLGCPHQCSFCNQRAISGQEHAPTGAEVTETCTLALSGGKLRPETTEIAFFGGSFTAIDERYQNELLEAAAPFVQRGQVRGIRVSTRPDAISPIVLARLKAYSVTAIELGAQSMVPDVLELARRGHTPEDVRAAAALIREAGFALGLQMMLGLRGDSDDGARFTARELAALGPAEARVYPTVVLRDTDLATEYLSGAYEPLSLEHGVDLAAELLEYFESRDIRVIRVGLHASADLERQMLAGCYHPAFRELCENHLMEQSVLTQLANIPAGPIILRVAPTSRSKLTGPGKITLKKLEAMGYNGKVVEDATLPDRKVLVERA